MRKISCLIAFARGHCISIDTLDAKLSYSIYNNSGEPLFYLIITLRVVLDLSENIVYIHSLYSISISKSDVMSVLCP